MREGERRGRREKERGEGMRVDGSEEEGRGEGVREGDRGGARSRV